jgi:hypothetical protein
MARKTTPAAEAAALLAAEQAEAEAAEAEQGEEAEADLRRSVVRAPYKAAYRARGTTKATKRGCGDWLHVRLIALTLDEKAKPVPGAFAAVCAANGVDVARWSHLNPGQVRMCGGMALRKVVATQGALVTPEGDVLTAPEAFCVRHGA